MSQQLIPGTPSTNDQTPMNENFRALWALALFGEDEDVSTGLTMGIHGGVMLVDGVLTTIADDDITLTDAATNYVEATRAGVFSANTTGFTAGRIPLYIKVCSGGVVTSTTDQRAWIIPGGVSSRLSLSVAGSADVTLTAAQARCEVLNFTGILTGDIDVIVPNGPQEWTVVNATTGSFSLTVKTSAGTGVVITQGNVHQVLADGTNVVNTATPAGVVSASGVSITDAGTYFTGTDVEAALQELGASVAALTGGGPSPAFRYTVDTGSTADSDPTAGLIKFNNATLSSVTAIYLDDETNDGVDLSTHLGALGAEGFVRLQAADDEGEWVVYKWTAITDDTGYFDVTVTYHAGLGTFEDGDEVLVVFDSDASSGAVDADDVTYTPTTLADWDGGSDPGDVEQALDQLAERVTDVEAADEQYEVDGTPAADDTWGGRAITGVNAGATIAQWEAVYMGSGGEWLLADATDDTTAPCRGVAAAAGTDNNPMSVLTEGVVRNDAWAWTPGGTLYLSTTAGGLTQTAPSATGEIVQQVGFAISADVAYLCIGAATYIEVA